MAHPQNFVAKRGISIESMARGLGWFSIGFGLAEIMLARTVSHGVGLPGRTGLVRAYGVREIGQGVGILASKRPRGLARWMWLRVAGDVLDMVTVAAALRATRSRKGRAAAAIASVAGITVVDVICANELRKRAQRQTRVWRDYGDRSGFPRGTEQMRGVAREWAAQRVGGEQEPARQRLQ